MRYNRGKFLGCYAPLGYVLNPDDRYSYVKNEVGATIVRKVFKMRCNGMSYLGIAKELNQDGVITPRDY